MRTAMAEAEVGDDVYGEDPNVNALEAEVAALLGKPAAVFVSSGTQANLLAVLSHCGRGDEYIAGNSAHAYRFEGGGAAVLGGVQPQPIEMTSEGELPLTKLRAAIKPDDPHFARTRLVCLENTHNGHPLDPNYVRAVASVCREHGLSLHLDGARLFNAAVAQQAEAKHLVAECDSVSVCLSKGLGAPVGSVLAGDRALVDAARRTRKMLGGGMRQAGVLAAAGRFALANNIDRFAQDHDAAAKVAAALRAHFPNDIRLATNMVFVGRPADEVAHLNAHMRSHGVRLSRERWVLHKDVDALALEHVLAVVADYSPLA